MDVHLFEVMDAGEYIYCGRIQLVDEPYVDMQSGEDGNDRKVWIFPIRPVPENDVKKPTMFVFKDMEDYKARGKNVDAEYIKILAEQKKAGKKGLQEPESHAPSIPPAPARPAVVIPVEIVGKRVRHKSYGEGTITEISDAIIIVSFDDIGEKKLGYEVCIKNRLIEFI